MDAVEVAGPSARVLISERLLREVVNQLRRWGTYVGAARSAARVLGCSGTPRLLGLAEEAEFRAAIEALGLCPQLDAEVRPTVGGEHARTVAPQ